jgi:hypothetical protein
VVAGYIAHMVVGRAVFTPKEVLELLNRWQRTGGMSSGC